MKTLHTIALAAIILLGARAAGAQTTPEEVSLFLTYVPNVQFAPVYTALERGEFASRGLNVTIEHGDEPVGVDLIAAGQRDFGIISGEQVIAARANERPVVSVYEWFQQYPIGVIVRDDAGVSAVADLRGKTVGIAGRFGASYTGLTALLAANGLTESDIALEPIGFNAPDVFCAGAVDAAVVYVNNEPLQIQHRIDAGACGDVTGVTLFPVADYAQLVSNGVVVNEANVDSQKTAAFVAAFAAGLDQAIFDPAGAYLSSLPHVENLPQSADFIDFLTQESADRRAQDTPEGGLDARVNGPQYRADLLARAQAQFAPDMLTQFEVLLASIPLWEDRSLLAGVTTPTPEQAAQWVAQATGQANAAAWEATQQTLLQMGYISAPIDVTAAFRNLNPGG